MESSAATTGTNVNLQNEKLQNSEKGKLLSLL